jgi:hypothetical protein
MLMSRHTFFSRLFLRSCGSVFFALAVMLVGTSPLGAVQPLITDDADVAAIGAVEVTLGYERGVRGTPRDSYGLLDVVTGIGTHFEAGVSSGLDHGRRADTAAALKGVTRPGAEDGWGQGLGLEHIWLRGGGREVTLAALFTRFTSWGGFDSNVGLAAPMTSGVKLGLTDWFAGQAVRYSPGQGFGAMAEVYGGGGIDSTRLDEAATRLAVTHVWRDGTQLATGVDVALRGPSRTTLFVAVTRAFGPGR